MISSDPVLAQQVNLNLLTPHPRYASIYGTDEDISDFVELIAERDWVKPLVVTTDYVIVSDQRPWRACQKLGKDKISVVIKEFPDELALLKVLLQENASRQKTIEQRIREGMAWEFIEKAKAKHRQGQRTDLTNIPENFPECSKGDSRDVIGAKIELSGRSYTKGRKIIERIDTLVQQGNEDKAKFLRSMLNKSIDTAYLFICQSAETQPAIAQLIETGKASTTRAALRLLQEQSTDSQTTQNTEQAKTPSCWNCQHRGESIDNKNIYCNKFGILSLITKSGQERGQECPEWRDRSSPPAPLKKPIFSIPVLLPLEWQQQLEETAASIGMDATTWITNLISAHLFPMGEASSNSSKQQAFRLGKKQDTNSNVAMAAVGTTVMQSTTAPQG